MIRPEEFKFGADFDPKEELKKAIVTHNEEIKRSEILLWLNDGGKKVNLFTRGNISAIIGKAKSRKTFFNTMVTAALLNGGIYDKFYCSNKDLKIAYFDTEQGRSRSQNVLKRIIEMHGQYNRITMLSLRPYSTEERVRMVETYMEVNQPDIVFIDGIRDLIMDFNNLTQATELMTSLMRWSEAHNSHLCCLLHMNKADGNARGHLGSELMNKAESVLSLEKEENYTTVKAAYMRDGDFEDFQFEIIDNIPCIVGRVPVIASEDHLTYDNNKYFEPNRDFDKLVF